ncbi:MFS transporter [Halorarius litoreus]|uniref:MFS transporter n=1 Tax=Halorarius litoreus TaxID=2962676 RepID=UPI0020CDBD17|nr:MFS transporter [Halorarius litoreus]
MPPTPDADDYHVPTIVGSLVAGVFIGGLGGGVAFPTLPTLGAVLGISPLLVGLILSTNRITRTVMNTPAGEIIDRLGTRRPMIVGFGLQGAAPFGYVLGLHPDLVPGLDSAALFILARAVWGVGSAFVFVGSFSTVVHVTSETNRGRWIGYFRGAQSMGFPTGLVAGGLLTDFYSYDVAFGTAGVLGLLAAVVAAAVLPDLRPAVETATSLRELPSVVRREPRIALIGVVNFAVRFLFAGVLLSTVVLYAQTYGIGIGDFSAVGASGLIMALSVLFAGGTTVAAGTLSDAVGNRALITLPALSVFAFGFALLGLFPTLPTTLVGVACIGVGVGGTNPPLLAYLGDISPEGDVGKLGGVYNVFGDLGSSLGPLVALPVAVQFGFRAEYLACAGLVVLVFVLVVATLLGGDLRPQRVP